MKNTRRRLNLALRHPPSLPPFDPPAPPRLVLSPQHDCAAMVSIHLLEHSSARVLPRSLVASKAASSTTMSSVIYGTMCDTVEDDGVFIGSSSKSCSSNASSTRNQGDPGVSGSRSSSRSKAGGDGSIDIEPLCRSSPPAPVTSRLQEREALACLELNLPGVGDESTHMDEEGEGGGGVDSSPRSSPSLVSSYDLTVERDEASEGSDDEEREEEVEQVEEEEDKDEEDENEDEDENGDEDEQDEGEQDEDEQDEQDEGEQDEDEQDEEEEGEVQAAVDNIFTLVTQQQEKEMMLVGLEERVR